MRHWILLAVTLVLVGCRSTERIIAKADGITVTAKELQEDLWRRYGSVALRELIQQKLLEHEAKKTRH
jgi:uncharacterized protein YcfL